MRGHFPDFPSMPEAEDGQTILPDFLGSASHPLAKFGDDKYSVVAKALIDSGFPVQELLETGEFGNRDIMLGELVLKKQYITSFSRRMVVPIDVQLKDKIAPSGRCTIDLFKSFVLRDGHSLVDDQENFVSSESFDANDSIRKILHRVMDLVQDRYRISNVKTRNANQTTFWVVDDEPRWILIDRYRRHLWLAFVTNTGKFSQNLLSQRLGVPVKINRDRFAVTDRVRIKITNLGQILSPDFQSVLDDLYLDFLSYKALPVGEYSVNEWTFTDSVDFTKIRWLKEVGVGDEWAYPGFPEGGMFWLHWPKSSRKYPAKPANGEIIVVKQNRRLSHLVTPVSSTIIETSEHDRWPFAREVMCLKIWGKEDAPMASEIFPFSLQGGSHGNGVELSSLVPRNPDITLLYLQKAIWRAFFPTLDAREVSVGQSQGTEEDGGAFLEGRLKQAFGYHRSRERNPQVVIKAKERAKQKDPNLHCEVCKFSFLKAYGQEYIEAHHIHPISERYKPTLTRVEDIALVCANCHRMLHRKQPGMSVETLKATLKATKQNSIGNKMEFEK
jgi:hypothetical protein